MIFVTVGTERHPFDRLVAEMDRIAASGVLGGEEVLIQTGASLHAPAAASSVPFLTYGETVEKVRAARLVIAHGGAGSFMVCRRHRVPLIMVPRLKRHGENVDDHQVLFCRRLAGLGLLTAVEDVAELAPAVLRALGAARAADDARAGGRLIRALRELAAAYRDPEAEEARA